MYTNPPKHRIRMNMLFLFLVACFVMLIMRLWTLQIENYDKYKNKVPTGSEKTVRIPGIRGEIFDRNGIKLAGNEPTYDIVFDLKTIKLAYIEKKRKENHGKHIDMPTYKYMVKVPGSAIEKERVDDDIAAIVDDLIMPNLDAWGLYVPYNADQLRRFFRSTNGVVPWTYRHDLQFDDYAFVSEHNISLPGVSVEVRSRRVYPMKAMLGHVLGYIRSFDIQKVPQDELKKWNYYVGDDFGASGLETTMNDALRGKPGVRRIQVNERGKLLGEVSYEEPKKGSDVFLTIDARVQYIAERALRDVDVDLEGGGHHKGLGRAATVVMDPSTGDILAMVSIPSYDPNTFALGIQSSQMDEYNNNEANPLLNRALQSYLPGSTFKIPVALAGCLRHLQNNHYMCRGVQWYGKTPIKCWIGSKGGSHGNMDLVNGIKNSCNCFFMQYGNQAGIANIKLMAELMGMNKKSGSELFDEDSGRVPDPGWLQLTKPGEPWTVVKTAYTSIGQDACEATPLQVCNLAAIIGNCGKNWKPRIINRVRIAEGQDAPGYEPVLRENLLEHGVTAKDIELVRQGMWQVVNGPGGTGKNAKIPGVEVAAKTGTAQFKIKGKQDDRVWLTCFAPFKQPKYAVVVIIEGGKSGGGVAAPIAQRIMQESLAIDQGHPVDIKPIDEDKGYLGFIVGSHFGKPLELEPSINEDDGTAGPEKM